MVSHFGYKHRCVVEENVPIALILPYRWQDAAESLGIEHTSCLCPTKSNWVGVGFYKKTKRQLEIKLT